MTSKHRAPWLMVTHADLAGVFVTRAKAGQVKERAR